MTGFIPGIGAAVPGIGGAGPYPSFAGVQVVGWEALELIWETWVQEGIWMVRGLLLELWGMVLCDLIPMIIFHPWDLLKIIKRGDRLSSSNPSMKKKALSYVQQFDNAFSRGNFTEASKIRKAASFLKGNAQQWWHAILLQGIAPTSWVGFKQLFSHIWLTPTFEVDTNTAWRSLSSRDCSTLDKYTKNFWDALLPIASFRQVPLVEQVETFCCGLPKELRDYCIKKRVDSMTHMIEIAQTGYALLTGQNVMVQE